MSTTVPSAPGAPVTLDLSKSGPTPFGRLVRVEWRKMVDTRGGFWLLAVTAGLIGLTVALTLLIVGLNDLGVTFNGLISNVMVIPVSLLVPVFAVLIVTSEWSQRSALTTFTLEPHRLRVIWAKLVAVSALAVTTIVVAFLFGALTNVLCGAITGNDVVWDLEPDRMFWLAVNQLIYFAIGFALGMLLLNTPAAIALYYVVSLILPMIVWGVLYSLFEWARDLIPWIDPGYALQPLISDIDPMGDATVVDAMTFVRVLFTIVLWVVIPVTLGALRLKRAEVK